MYPAMLINIEQSEKLQHRRPPPDLSSLFFPFPLLRGEREFERGEEIRVIFLRLRVLIHEIFDKQRLLLKISSRMDQSWITAITDFERERFLERKIVISSCIINRY